MTKIQPFRRRTIYVSALAALLAVLLPPKDSHGQGSVVIITSPAANSTIRGVVNITVSASIPGLESIEYLLNGRLVQGGRLAVPPFQLRWNSAEVWDGSASLTAVARDAVGNVLATSSPVSFTIDNHPASMRLLSPAAASTLSGTVNWSVDASDPTADIEAVMFFLDGKQVGHVWGTGPSYSVNLDTSLYGNGPHELFAAAHSALNPHRPPVAMAQTVVQFQNGRTVRGLRPRWRELYLLPGESANLQPALIYTDSSHERAPSPVYRSSNGSIATVGSDGTVRGVAPGITTVVTEANGRQAQTRVVVDSSRTFPHFARDGGRLTSYQASRSEFIRTMFFLDANELEADPSLALHVRTAGITALTSGFWPSPAALGNPRDFNEWKSRWDPWWARVEDSARRNNLGLVVIGDDIARQPSELGNSLFLPWSAQALRYAFTKLRDSGRVQAIEMVDEISMLWGNTPTPTDGRWRSRNPSIPDDAFTRLMNIFNQVSNRTPLTWPVLWHSGPTAVRNWMGNPSFSDYATFFWDNNAWREAYPWGISLGQVHDSLEAVVVGNQNSIQRDRPFLILMGVNGAFYTKLGPGDEFVPGQDRPRVMSHRPISVSSQIAYMAGLGAAGVRVYGFDFEGWKWSRRERPAGTEHLQTGAHPHTVGTERWQAMAAGMQMIARLEPHLLQPRLHSLNLGPEIHTAAREGSNSRLLLTVNLSESEQKELVDLSSFRYAGAGTVTRLRLAGGSLGSDTVPAADSEEITFQPGEAVAWLFQPAADAAVAPPSIRIAKPLPDVVANNTVLVEGVTGGPTPVRVEFLVDGRPTGVRVAPPFHFNWDTGNEKQNVWHAVILRAYDAAGGMNEARVAVKAVARTSGAANRLPAVSITSPAFGANFTAPADVNLTATASDPDGSIAQVQFFHGATLLGTDTTNQYSLTWSNAPSGSYSITARVTDNLGAVGVSAPVSITVTGASTSPPLEPEPPPAVEPSPAPARSFLMGVNLGGAALTIEGNPWLSQTSALTSGLTVTNMLTWTGNYSFPLLPSSDGAMRQLLQTVGYSSSPPNGQGFTLTRQVANGDYQVYLYMVENHRSNYRNVDVRIQGGVAATNIGDLPLGGWRKYGPYAARVTNGALRIEILRSSKGDPLLAGFSIFTAEDSTSDEVPEISLTSPAPGSSFAAPAGILLEAAVSDPHSTVRKVVFFRDGTFFAADTTSPYRFYWRSAPAGSYSFTAEATHYDGRVRVSAPVNVTVTDASAPTPEPDPTPTPDQGPPQVPTPSRSFYKGVNLAGPALTIEGNQWLSQMDAFASGLTATNMSIWTGTYSFTLSPVPDADTRRLLQTVGYISSPPNGQGFTLAQTVPNGDYEVFLYMVENYRNDFRNADVKIQGVVAATAIGDLPLGAWEKYGPYAARVTNGVLRIEVLGNSKGDPLLAGFSLFK